MTDQTPRTEAGRALVTGEATRQLFHVIDGRRDDLIRRILAIEAEAAQPAPLDERYRALVGLDVATRSARATKLLDAVEEALGSEALPGNVHRRLGSAYNAVVEEANR